MVPLAAPETTLPQAAGEVSAGGRGVERLHGRDAGPRRVARRPRHGDARAVRRRRGDGADARGRRVVDDDRGGCRVVVGPDVRDRVLDALRLERQGHGPVATAGQVDGPRGAAARRRPDDAPRGAPAGDQVRGGEPADALIEGEREGEGRALRGRCRRGDRDDRRGDVRGRDERERRGRVRDPRAAAHRRTAERGRVRREGRGRAHQRAFQGRGLGAQAGARGASRRSPRRVEQPAMSRCRCRTTRRQGPSCRRSRC